jgi:hypothetical protein
LGRCTPAGESKAVTSSYTEPLDYGVGFLTSQIHQTHMQARRLHIKDTRLHLKISGLSGPHYFGKIEMHLRRLARLAISFAGALGFASLR